MATEQRAGILHVQVALDEALEEVAQRPGQRDCERDLERLQPGEVLVVQGQPAGGGSEDEPDQEALDGLFGEMAGASRRFPKRRPPK